jgi:hypothetical protein
MAKVTTRQSPRYRVTISSGRATRRQSCCASAVHHGKSETIMGMAMIAADYAMHHYDVLELVAEGDVVWMIAGLDMTSLRSGTNFKLSLASRWGFRDGLRIGITEYYDSASVALVENRVTVAA